jgi:hypothetical protein
VEKSIAEESPQLRRAREKLRISLNKNVFTDDEVEKKISQIKNKIDRERNREIITTKSFKHFDNNQNPAPISAKIKQLSSQLGLDTKRLV